EPNGTNSFLSTQAAALESRDLAERVIRTYRLADNAAFVDGTPERPGVVAGTGRLVNAPRPPGWSAPSLVPPPDRRASTHGGSTSVLDRYRNYLKVQEVRGTDLVEVRFTTPSPSLSAFLAAAHAQAYLETNEEARLATNVTAKDFLSRQLAASRAAVERAQQ